MANSEPEETDASSSLFVDIKVEFIDLLLTGSCSPSSAAAAAPSGGDEEDDGDDNMDEGTSDDTTGVAVDIEKTLQYLSGFNHFLIHLVTLNGPAVIVE